MKLTIAVQMEYEVQPGDPALLAIMVAPAPGQAVIDDELLVEDAVLRWIAAEGDSGARVWATPGADRLRLRYDATVAITRRDAPLDALAMTPWPALPADVLGLLRPSRYCPSDQFEDFVAQQFGTLEGGAKIRAMADWITRNIAYVPGSSHGGTTAIETCATRQGVCRDFAHVMCTLTRAAGFPARYTTGYAPQVSPPDFHAVAEIWLGDGWHIVDPTGMASAATLAIIATGRDAADTAFMETALWARPVAQSVRVTGDE